MHQPFLFALRMLYVIDELNLIILLIVMKRRCAAGAFHHSAVRQCHGRFYIHFHHELRIDQARQVRVMHIEYQFPFRKQVSVNTIQAGLLLFNRDQVLKRAERNCRQRVLFAGVEICHIAFN